jgi:hypothetical protein
MLVKLAQVVELYFITQLPVFHAALLSLRSADI